MADNNPFPILPQYQGDYLDAQRRMAIAQALQAQTFSPDQGTEGWNQMRVVPRLNPLSGVARIGQALLANKAYQGAIGAQRQLGQEQWQGLQSMFGGQPQTSYQATSQDQSGQPTYPPMSDASQPQRMVSAPQPSAMNPAGLPPQLAAMQYIRDPSGYMKEFVAPSYQPTEATRLARAAGVDPTQANLGALAKANNIAPPEGRPGGYTYIPQVGPNGQVTYQPQFNQPIPEGGMPIYDASGRQIPGTASLPGAANVAQTQAMARALPGAMLTPVSGVSRTTGLPAYTNQAEASGALGGGGSSMFPGVTGLGAQSDVVPGLPVGATELVSDAIKRNQSVLQAASNAPADINAFRQIDAAAQNAKTGVGFDRSAAWKSMASVIPGIDPNASDKVNSDIINKYSQQIAGRNGGRSDAALETALHSITNSSMSPQAIHELTPSLIGLRMADIGNANARQAWMKSHANAPASLSDYEDQWRAAYDPDAYRVQAMNTQQRTQFIDSLTPQRAQALRQSRQRLQALGALPDMGQ